MKNIYKSVSLILCISILISTVAFYGVFASAEEPTYSVGDIIEFGSYPQTDVTNELGDVLNEIEGTWKSYNYYSGSGVLCDGHDAISWADGKMKSSNFMRYKDVNYKNKKYRGVVFDTFRPWFTGEKIGGGENIQSRNGYSAGEIYWFEYTPLKWRVLDPTTGLIMCNSIIDSQPYSNYVIYNRTDGEYYNEYGKYASDWETSDLRIWLNNDFYDVAFSNEQKSNILTSINHNKSWKYGSSTIGNGSIKYDSADTYDKVFVLSYDDVANSNYGFSSDFSDHDKNRQFKGTDYAKCQGLLVYTELEYYSNWWRRSPCEKTSFAFFVLAPGLATNYAEYVYCTFDGVVPVIKLQNITAENSSYNTNTSSNLSNVKITVKPSATVDYRSSVTITATAENVPKGYVLAIYEGNTLKEMGTNTSISYTPLDKNGKPIELTSYTVYTVKIVDSKKIIQKDSYGFEISEKCEITVKNSFFDKLIAFFRGLFGMLPMVKI